MANVTPTRILILCRGFTGLTVAMELDRKLGRTPGAEVMLIICDNFSLFTPMLHEVAASDLDLTTIVNPVHKVLRHVHFFVGQVEQIDIVQKSIVVSHGFDRHHHTLPFDLLVIGLGSVTNLYGISGLEEHALTMKTLGDAMRLRTTLSPTWRKRRAIAAW
jgi:NADH:ubiquinone reductase (H+-translocating)